MKDKEEFANVLTHLFGAAAGVIAIPLMMGYAIDSGLTVSCAVYGVTLLMMFMSSTAYHYMMGTGKELLWRKVDHCCIYLFIAGSYTPFVVGFFDGTLELTTLGVVWSVAILGSLGKIFRKELKDYSLLSVISYILLGWYLLIIFPYALAYMPSPCIIWLIIGGVCYTSGVYFYVNDRRPFYHTIWHLHVLAGCSCHYYAIVSYVV